LAHLENAIIIPAYNEAASIRRVVECVKEYGRVIVVDDASKDQTRAEALSGGAIVVNHSVNLGYDGALNSGFQKAAELRCAYAITLDGDGQHEPTSIPTYFNLLKENDLVLGIRPHKARFAEKIMGIYFEKKYGIKDVLCGMKGYRMSLYFANDGFDHIGSIGTELAVMSIKRGIKFAQIPVAIHRRDGKPRFGNLIKSNVKILSACIRLFNKGA
jgi:glycosyltransferase involved in cell wall biosynthesis